MLYCYLKLFFSNRAMGNTELTPESRRYLIELTNNMTMSALGMIITAASQMYPIVSGIYTGMLMLVSIRCSGQYFGGLFDLSLPGL